MKYIWGSWKLQRDGERWRRGERLFFLVGQSLTDAGDNAGQGLSLAAK